VGLTTGVHDRFGEPGEYFDERADAYSPETTFESLSAC
jgi:hypothetical protein